MKFFVLLAACCSTSVVAWLPSFLRSRNDAQLQTTPRHDDPHHIVDYAEEGTGVQGMADQQSTARPFFERMKKKIKKQMRGKRKPRKDPYAEPPAGEATADEYCAKGKKHFDPVCTANKAVLSLKDEIALVMKEMICKVHPEKKMCGMGSSQIVSAARKHLSKRKAKKADMKKKEAAKLSKPPQQAEVAPAAEEPASTAPEIAAPFPVAPAPASQVAPAPAAETWTKEHFLEVLHKKVGDSDEAFKTSDADHDGHISEEEFENLCWLLNAPDSVHDLLFGDMSDSAHRPVSEVDFKDYLGATNAEIRRRILKKYGSANEAFLAADEDGDGEVSNWEAYEQCSLVAQSTDCQQLHDSLPEMFWQRQYIEWMTGQAGAPAPAPASAAPAAGSLENVENLVGNLEDIKKKLKKEGRYDPELGKSVDLILKESKTAVKTMEVIEEMPPEEAGEELDDLEEEVQDVDDKVFRFQTEIHPHGYKWWRYRWEYAFVEANVLNLLVFLTMGCYYVLNLVWERQEIFSMWDEKGDQKSIVNVFFTLFQRQLHELNVLGIITVLIWLLEECGLFWAIMKAQPVTLIMKTQEKIREEMSDYVPTRKVEDMHLPTTDTHYINCLRTVNVHLFVGLIIYYSLMYHVIYAAAWILMGFMRHEAPEAYEDMTSQDKEIEETEIYKGLPEGMKHAAGNAKTFYDEKGRLAKAFEDGTLVRRFIGYFDKPEDFTALKDYLASRLGRQQAFQEEDEAGEPLAELIKAGPLYPYFSRILRNGLKKMIIIDWRVWLMVQLVLVLQALLHYFLHMAVIEILPFSIGLGVLILVGQYIWTYKQAAYVLDPANKEPEDDYIVRLEASTFYADGILDAYKGRSRRENFIIWLQQLNLFFLCFSFARLSCSFFFWTDYPGLSLITLLLFSILYLAFVVIGAISIVFFILLHAVPPHMYVKAVEMMQNVARQNGKRHRTPTSSQTLGGGMKASSKAGGMSASGISAKPPEREIADTRMLIP